MEWFNRFLCWLTGRHIYSDAYFFAPLGTRPVCDYCLKDLWDLNSRCTGWPKTAAERAPGGENK